MGKYSVLMSVYYKEKPEYLEAAMNSMLTQSAAPAEFVLICDGPLTEELDAVIADKKKNYPDILRVIRFPENRGLGKALQIGVRKCSNDLIARMDSDDISLPDRCEKQLAYMEAHPEVSILGGTIAEFESDPSVTTSKRVLPENNEEIIEFSKSRNPFNHMTVMYRKEDVLDVGGYKHFPFLEDYYLWIRMLIKGYKGHNLQDVLVHARIGNGMMARRAGIEYAKLQKKLFRYMYDNNYITIVQYAKSVIGRTVVSVAPPALRKLLYDSLLRK